MKIDIPAEALASLPAGGHLAPEAVDCASNSKIWKSTTSNLPPLHAQKSRLSLRAAFSFHVPKGVISLAGRRAVDFTDGEFIVGDLRPRVPAAEIPSRRAKANQRVGTAGPAGARLHPRAGYEVPEIDASVLSTFSLSMPLLPT